MRTEHQYSFIFNWEALEWKPVEPCPHLLARDEVRFVVDSSTEPPTILDVQPVIFSQVAFLAHHYLGLRQIIWDGRLYQLEVGGRITNLFP